MADDPIDEIAAELAVADPRAFVATRAERATSLGDRELAARVRALRKPLAAAWAVNLLAQRFPAEIDRIGALAAELIAAQASGDRTSVSELGRRRRALVDELTSHAAALAERRGQALTTATRAAVAQTLNAAVLDPRAAAAVASGRLIRPLEPSDGLVLALAGTPPRAARDRAPEAPRGEPTETMRAAAPDADTAYADAAAERRRGARRAVAEAESALRAWRERRDEAVARAGDADERISSLLRELARARREASTARDELDRIESDGERLAERLRDAQGLLREADR
ncbi:hypothetical protein [Microbacterium sp. NPDC055683]